MRMVDLLVGGRTGGLPQLGLTGTLIDTGVPKPTAPLHRSPERASAEELGPHVADETAFPRPPPSARSQAVGRR